MQTKLSEQVVYNYIKNFFYDPVYDITSTVITASDFSEVPEFSSTAKYVVGAYLVKDNELYISISDNSGPWAQGSIANIYLGEDIRTGDNQYVADNETGEYDSNRFKPVELKPSEERVVYKLYNPRTQVTKMVFDTVAQARDYLREYTKSSDYEIHVEKISNNEYLATWDGNSMIFYD